MSHHVGLPGAQFSPGVEDGYFQSAVRLFALYVVVDQAEFIRYFLNIIHEFREFISQA